MSSRRRAPGSAVMCGAVCVAAALAQAQPPSRASAVPLDPIDAILEAFQSHQIVALGEGAHNNLQGHAFRLDLIRDRRFPSAVNDIVVESGSAKYQDVIDRFVRGETVPANAVRDALEDTVGAPPAWDRPMYEEFFRAVREVNAGLPRQRHLRILLGDPPIDWTAVHNRDDYNKWLLQRDAHPAAVVEREAIAAGRRALVIYGDGHFQARSERPPRSLAAIVESRGRSLFAITSTFADLSRFQSDVASWRTPALARLRGTALGTVPYDVFFGPAPPTDYFRANPRIEDHFDAVLYLGTARSMGPLSYPRCADPEYVSMRVGRMLLAGMPSSAADRLAQECAAAAKAAPGVPDATRPGGN